MMRIYFSIFFLLTFSFGGVFLLNDLSRPLRRFSQKTMSPNKYQKNQHAAIAFSQAGNFYQYNLTFKDHLNRWQTWQWQFEKAMADRLAAQFGIPNSMFQPYYATEQVISQRQRILKQGLFRSHQNKLVVDQNAYVSYYGGFTAPLYEMLNVAAGAGASRVDKIQLLLKLVQDIPYGVPPSSVGSKYISGIINPPDLLRYGWGDCDSKALLFASILKHFPQQNMIAVHTPGHYLTAVESVPRPYQDFITYQGKRYVFCESAGPGRFPLGYINKQSPIVQVEPIHLLQDRVSPAVAGAHYRSGQIAYKGNVFKFRIADGGTYLRKENIKILIQGSGSSYYYLDGDADSDGYFYYNSDQPSVNLWIQKEGIVIKRVLKTESAGQPISFNLTPQEAIVIQSAPGAKIGVYQKQDGGRYWGHSYNADKNGLLRMILADGEYNIIANSEDWQKPSVRFSLGSGVQVQR